MLTAFSGTVGKASPKKVSRKESPIKVLETPDKQVKEKNTTPKISKGSKSSNKKKKGDQNCFLAQLTCINFLCLAIKCSFFHPGLDLEDEVLNEVYTTVLAHLRKEKLLAVDDKGFVSLICSHTLYCLKFYL